MIRRTWLVFALLAPFHIAVLVAPASGALKKPIDEWLSAQVKDGAIERLLRKHGAA